MLAGWSVGLSACQAAPVQAGMHDPASGCGAERVQDAIGRRRSDSLAAALRRRSGATALRFVALGEIHTMEFRADRLTVTLDAHGRVARLLCG